MGVRWVSDGCQMGVRWVSDRGPGVLRHPCVGDGHDGPYGMHGMGACITGICAYMVILVSGTCSQMGVRWMSDVYQMGVRYVSYMCQICVR